MAEACAMVRPSLSCKAQVASRASQIRGEWAVFTNVVCISSVTESNQPRTTSVVTGSAVGIVIRWFPFGVVARVFLIFTGFLALQHHLYHLTRAQKPGCSGSRRNPSMPSDIAQEYAIFPSALALSLHELASSGLAASRALA